MSKHIVFIDSRISEKEVLINHFGADTEYHILDADRDGMHQIADALSGKAGYNSIQIFSHGSPGSLLIGSTTLDSNSISSYNAQLSAIGQALTADGDILLYGCNVGAGDVGAAFVDMIANATGADVAASDDLTGGIAVGGDWELEVVNGAVEIGMPIHSTGLSQYSELLEVHNNHEYVEIAIHEYPGDTNSKVIGVAIFDLSLDGGTEANFNNFVALISNYERGDINFDGVYSWGELLVSSILPENLGKSSFTYTAFKHLALELLDVQFDQKANQIYVSIAADLTAWGFSQAYGIEKSFIETLANKVGGPIIGSIVENAVNGFIPQFFLKKGLEYLLDELVGDFTPDETDMSYDIYYIESAEVGYNDDHDYLYDGSSSSDSASISTGGGNDILIGGSGNDTLNGGSGRDTIFARDGNDTINPGKNNDTVHTGAGNDTVNVVAVRGHAQSDTVDGGSGTDTLNLDYSDEKYSQYNTWYSRNFDYGVYDAEDVRTTLGYTSSLTTVQTALGSAVKIVFDGYYTDVHATNFEVINLKGSQSNDLLIYQLGGSYDGQGGTDTFYADWSDRTAAVEWTNGGEAYTYGDVTVSNIERLLLLTGSGDDVIDNTAFSTSDEVRTGAGDDTISLGIGNDTVAAGEGDDTVSPGKSSDKVDTGAGNDTVNVVAVRGHAQSDTVDGGSGTDTLNLDYSDEKYSQYNTWYSRNFDYGVYDAEDVRTTLGYTSSLTTVQTALGSAVKIVFDGYYTDVHATNFEVINLKGSQSNDLLIYQLGGSYDGQGGTDTFYADWSDRTAAVEWTNGGEAYTYGDVTVSNIERLLLLTGSGDDVIDNTAFSTSDEVRTGAGDDTISLGIGNDTVAAGEGDDTIDAGSGTDTIDGGDGDDTVTFRGTVDQYTISYDRITDIYTVTDSVAGRDGVDTLIDVEFFQFADVIESLPEAISFNPATASVDAGVDQNIIITFSKAIHAGSGTIELHDTNGLVESFDVATSQNISFIGDTLTIDPSANLAHETTYSLVISKGSILDINGFAYDPAGDVYAFTTEEPGHTVSGAVTFWQDDEPIDAVETKLFSLPNGADEASIITSADGHYSFDQVAENQYSIEGSKAADSSLYTAVKATDALAALKIAVAMNPNNDGSEVESWQYLAADVNKDGKVQATDALAILKMAVKMDDAPDPEWLIIPESAGDHEMSRTEVIWPDEPEYLVNQDMEVDFVGIVKGDVDGSWTVAETHAA
ncbi:DUF4347 domain-containing protein [Prosthecochloris sp.]|uniref:DUF4347 domain-containing protein n=1 Tax=Prosthecochloris sp. TaxID=290513 RepID=UPI00257F7D61|nr:DUF4347 domain-containing protein [Prosthecochloris sp.]